MNNLHDTSRIALGNIMQHIQRYYEMYSVLFPAGVLATHVGVMDRN
jgi:hypothetical protein